jgi:hypothetical protein
MKPQGNSIVLGPRSDGRGEVVLSPEQRSTHLYVAGGTGTGKSKFLENLIRQDILNWRKSKCGMLVLDPHGSLYDDLMAWCAWHNIDRPIVPIDLRRDDRIISYNLLRKRTKADPAVVVSNFVQAMAYVWGQADTTSTPLFARWASNVIGTLYEKGLTLLEAEQLLDRVAKTQRQIITNGLRNSSAARDWAYANTLSPKDFEREIGSTLNRLHTFLSTQAMREMFGRGGASLDLGKAIEEGQIIIVSLATEGARVSEEDVSLFATLLLSDLWTAAKERGKGAGNPFYVYVDEFQNFVTPTIARNLDEARGFGLHLTLAHQFPNQLLHHGAHGRQVYDSVMVNARTKVVFSIEGEENLKPLAQALFTGTMTPDKIKLELYSTKVMDYAEETRTSRTRSKSESSGGGSQRGNASGEGTTGSKTYPFSRHEYNPDPTSTSESESGSASVSESEREEWSESSSESETESSILVPIMGKELSSVQFESLEEQLFRSMAVLLDQQQRQCVVRVVGTKLPVSVVTPTVKGVPKTQERVLTYENKKLGNWTFASETRESQKLTAPKPDELDFHSRAHIEAHSSKRSLNR